MSRGPSSPSAPIRFAGSWTDDERDQIETALERATQNMSTSQRRVLRGNWLARVRTREEGRYFVLHRRGMTEAFTGATAGEIVNQIRRRWAHAGRDAS